MKEIKKARMGIIAVLAVMLVSTKRRLPEMRKLSSGITTLALVGIVLLVAAGSASANGVCVWGDISAGEYYEHGDTVLVSCDLNDTMDCSGSGLIIGADGVTIDGCNFGIVGNDILWSYGIHNEGYHNVVIKNLEISKFHDGVCIKGILGGASAAKVENNTIYNCTVHHCGSPADGTDPTHHNSGYGIHFYENVWNSTINECIVHDTHPMSLSSSCESCGAGIRLFKGSGRNNVTNCKSYRNDLAGIYSKGGCKHNYAYNNDVYENGLASGNSFPGGIRMQCKNTNWWNVSENTVRDNYGPGIFVGGQNCTVYKNEVTGSKNCTLIADGSRGDGLIIDRADTAEGGRYNNVTNNTVCDNEGYDILIVDASPSKVGNHGDENMCDKPYNWDDDGTSGCTYPCPSKPNLVITDKHETWIVSGVNYTVTYTVENQGGAASVASATALYIDNVYNTADTTVPALNPSQTYTYTFAGPFTLAGSCDDISLLADRGDVNDECDENNWKNNTFCSKPKLTVVPPAGCVNPGIFTVDIDVDPNGLPVYGVQYKLTYNKDVIRLDMQNEDDFLKEGGTYETMVTNYDIDNVNGVATYGITRKNTLFGRTNPEGTLVVLTFQVVGSAGQTAWINLSEIVVSNNESVDIGAELTNDSVEICAANQKPDANASSNHLYNNVGSKYLCYATLNGSESTDPDGKADIVDYVWACGDGQFGGLEILPHIYSSYYATGMSYTPFTATLTVTDTGGLSDDADCSVNVYIAGDANGDCVVNILDASMTGLRWNADADDEVNYPGVCWGMTLPSNNVPGPLADMADKADLNNDNDVNILDTSIVGLCWGDTC